MKNKTKQIKFYKVDQCNDNWRYIGIESDRFPEISSDGNTWGTIEKYAYIKKNQDEFLLVLEGLKPEYNGKYTIIIRENYAIIRKESLKGRENSKPIEVKWGKVTKGYLTKKRKEKYERLGLTFENHFYKTQKELNPRNAIKVIFENLDKLKTFEETKINIIENYTNNGLLMESLEFDCECGECDEPLHSPETPDDYEYWECKRCGNKLDKNEIKNLIG